MATPFMIKKRQIWYLRLRIPADLAALLGRTHFVKSLETGHRPNAQALAAASAGRAVAAWSEARRMIYEWMGRPIDQIRLDDLLAAGRDRQRAVAEFDRLPDDKRDYLLRRIAVLVCWQERKVNDEKMDLEEIKVRLEIARDARAAGAAAGAIEALTKALIRQAATPTSPAAPVAAAGADDEIDGKDPWKSYIPEFFKNRPGLTEKTKKSYLSVFDEWEKACKISHLPLRDISVRHTNAYADHLRDRESIRDTGQQLNRKTIVKMLGHVKTFMAWAIEKNHVADKGFEKTKARQATREEREDTTPRRALTKEEMQRLFDSPIFAGYAPGHRTRPGNVLVRDDYFWFLVIAAMTGMRPDEIARAPARLKKIGEICCIDLTGSETKTPAGKRLIPVIKDLRRLGFIEYADEQARRGHGLILNSKRPISAQRWSQRLNRYIDDTVVNEKDTALYSLRHSFKQILRASVIGDELMHKIFGHEGKDNSVGEGYGRALSEDEARTAYDRIKFPIAIEHLIAGRFKNVP